MPRVYQKTARKDYPAFNIVAGQVYYEWKFRNQKPRKSPSYPTRSMLTNSSFLSAVYDIWDIELPAAEDGDALKEIASTLRDLGSECEDSRSNMPQSLQDAPTGEMLQTRADACEEAATEIENAADELDNELEAINERERAWTEWLESRPGETEGDDTQEQPDDVGDDEWAAWLEAKPLDDESDTDFDAERKDARDEVSIDEPDWG